MSVNLVNQEIPKHEVYFKEKAFLWVHDHPTTVKVIQVAALVLGVGILASLPFTAPILGAGLIAALAITGVVLGGSSLLTLLFLDTLRPSRHDMANHLFKPGKCEGGELYYDGDVPILSLQSDDPFVAGKAHGYLCGDAITEVNKKFLDTHVQSDLTASLNAVRETIPKEYLREMEGFVAGYNEWIKKDCSSKFVKPMTVDDVILLHLIPDSLHFDPYLHHFHGQDPMVACTAIVEKDSARGMVFARNMDWASRGVAGSYSLVIHRKHKDGRNSTAEVGVAGFIGTLTGMNDKGLSLSMNVCQGPTSSIRGMPACFFNRACLERLSSVDDVDKFVFQDKNSPLGPYHMTLADKNRAESIHFYQGYEGFAVSHVKRELTGPDPLTVLNYRYNPEPIGNYLNQNIERAEILKKFYAQRQGRGLEEALALPSVNNSGTTHRVVMEPQKNTMHVAFDNFYAGAVPLRRVDLAKLFARDVS